MVWRYIYDKMQFSVIGIVCSKSRMHPPEAEGQKPVSGIMQIVNMQKGIVAKGITQIDIMQREGGVRRGMGWGRGGVVSNCC